MSEDKITKDGKRFRIKDVVSIEITFTINEIIWLNKKAIENMFFSTKAYIKQKALEGYNEM